MHWTKMITVITENLTINCQTVILFKNWREVSFYFF